MKARVKATGEIVELSDLEYDVYGNDYLKTELEITDEPDYWEKLKHQYAGVALQGILSNPEQTALYDIECVEQAVRMADLLINKLKEDSQCEK